MTSDPYIEAKLSMSSEYGKFERSASGEMEKAMEAEYLAARQSMPHLYNAPRQRQISQKTIDKRRKAAKVARKQRKRKHG